MRSVCYYGRTFKTSTWSVSVESKTHYLLVLVLYLVLITDASGIRLLVRNYACIIC